MASRRRVPPTAGFSLGNSLGASWSQPTPAPFTVHNMRTQCMYCGFKSKSSRGLKAHIRTQHRISQIDGADDLIEESKSIRTQTEQSCDYYAPRPAEGRFPP